jgi:predicted DNA-binding transcriptional regulator AlpA
MSAQRRHPSLDKYADRIIRFGAAPGDAPDDLLTTKEIANWLGRSVEWLEIGRSKNYKYGPKFVRLGPKTIRYRRSDVVEWLESRLYESTAEYDQPPTSGRKRKARWGFVRGS